MLCSHSLVKVPWWKVLCGHIVEILLCEGGDVEQRLEPRNISLYLRLIYFLLPLFISCIDLLAYIHMLDIICVPTLVLNQESF